MLEPLMPPGPTKPSQPSELFTVRVWREELGSGQAEWRGKVQHVLGGETRYFREWAGLIAHLSAMMADAEQKSDQPNAG